jgi:hypothetical protein
MPRGRYSLHDPPDGALAAYERFSCAPGPVGWRYTSAVLAADGRTVLGQVDLTVDARWRQRRVEVRAGEWLVRGGVNGPEAVWLRTAASQVSGQPVELAEQAAGFTGRSPGFLVAVARLLHLAVGESARVRLVGLSEPVLAPITVETAWALTSVDVHDTDTGPLEVERYETTDRGIVHLAGDVVLAAPGIELEELDSPPST